MKLNDEQQEVVDTVFDEAFEDETTNAEVLVEETVEAEDTSEEVAEAAPETEEAPASVRKLVTEQDSSTGFILIKYEDTGELFEQATSQKIADDMVEAYYREAE